jgi:cytochrome oxidase Cu insertion factor (SCO1/SenC/PrrC family)
MNQDGQAVTLSGFLGKVVLLTGMYASCTCPLIMSQAKRAIGALEPAERRHVVFVAVTLDPAHDDQVVLEKLARGWGVRAPEYHFLWGEPGRVNPLLDRMEIARTMDMTTGAIDHANLFILIDKGGKVAYRLSLSQRQENWLVDALRVLAREPQPSPG